MSEAIRIGVIGTSEWLEFLHFPTLKADPRVTLSALCGRNRERAQAIASKYAIPQVFTDYHEMISHGDLQAILIGAPDDQHYAMTMAALDAGLHVLCEKPLALSEAHAQAMYEQAEARGVRHMTFFTWRWMPLYRYMRELIEKGVLGQLYHCQFTFFMGYGRDQAYQWRFDRARAHGIVGDLGVHMFDLAYYLAGDISRVNAQIAAHVPRYSVDGQPIEAANDSATILLQFANGAQGTVQISAVAHTGDTICDQQIALHGEAASLIADMKLGHSEPQLQLASKDEPFQTVTIPDHFLTGIDQDQPFISQFEPLFTHQTIGWRLFIDSILANRTVAPSFYEGWKAQQVIEAALRAHESGHWIDL